jgi:hypothetical protein
VLLATAELSEAEMIFHDDCSRHPCEARIGQGKVAPGVFIKQPGTITPELPSPTTQILVVTPDQIGQGKVAPGVFIKQPSAITRELPSSTT